MTRFLSCDWGTSSFRLRLVEAETLTIVDEEKTSLGIAQTFQLWRENEKAADNRWAFYLDIIEKHLKIVEKKLNISLDDLPLIISGMASSTIGMLELSYTDLPVSVNGENLKISVTAPTNNFKHTVVIISGIKTADDVMRGEETKLIGCACGGKNTDEQIYIFPGTHPKHVTVQDGKAVFFKTYMTGEFFELLSKKSILAVSVKEGSGFKSEKNYHSFAKGVNDSADENILHSCFFVRTNDLFKKLSLEENYYYLSGLLIGAEMNDLRQENQNIVIVGNAVLNEQYIAALSLPSFSKQGRFVTSMDADEALIKGQIQVYKKQVALQ